MNAKEITEQELHKALPALKESGLKYAIKCGKLPECFAGLVVVEEVNTTIIQIASPNPCSGGIQSSWQYNDREGICDDILRVRASMAVANLVEHLQHGGCEEIREPLGFEQVEDLVL